MAKEMIGAEAGRNAAATWEAQVTLDITRDSCPMTFVRTRLALDRMAAGEVLLVLLRGDEPRRNVPRTAGEQGHRVLGLEGEADGTARLLIRKGG